MKRPRSPLWARIALVAGVILLVGSSGAFAATEVATKKVESAIPDKNLLGNSGTNSTVKHVSINGAKNILLVSLDTRPSWSTSGEPSRSDSIIILHIPADHSMAYMLSIPRDTLVSIPACPGCKQKYRGGRNKINSAFAFGSNGLDGDAAIEGGTQLLAATIKRDFGITPDAAAVIDFSGFKQIINVLGQVCMYVDENVISIHVGKTADGKFAVPYHTWNDGTHPEPNYVDGKKVIPNTYKIGNHCFDSTQALDYARQRDKLSKGDGDYGRQRHQQQLLKAIMKTAVSKGLSSPTKLPGLLDAVGKAMTVAYGGISLEDWAFAMKGINPDSMVTLRTNGDNPIGYCNVPSSQTPSGVGDAQCLDTQSQAMFAAAKSDTLSSFVAAHPSWVSQA